MLLKTKSDSLQESRSSPGSAEEQLNKKTTCTILAAHFRRKDHPISNLRRIERTLALREQTRDNENQEKVGRSRSGA
jgi:predicted type IV restriction endonuclease